MSATKQTTIWCDWPECDIWDAVDESVSSAARRALRDIGWKYASGLDLCPTHASR